MVQMFINWHISQSWLQFSMKYDAAQLVYQLYYSLGIQIYII